MRAAAVGVGEFETALAELSLGMAAIIFLISWSLGAGRGFFLLKI